MHQAALAAAVMAVTVMAQVGYQVPQAHLTRVAVAEVVAMPGAQQVMAAQVL